MLTCVACEKAVSGVSVVVTDCCVRVLACSQAPLLTPVSFLRLTATELTGFLLSAMLPFCSPYPFM
jgi:hypothetical protein